MPPALANVLAVLSTLAGGVASLFMIGLMFASMPNGTPEKLAEIRHWMLAIGVIALLGLGGAIWMMVVRRPGLAAGVGISPALFCIVALVIMWRSGT